MGPLAWARSSAPLLTSMDPRGDVTPWALSLKPDVISDVTSDVTSDVPSIELSWRAEALKPEWVGLNLCILESKQRKYILPLA